MLKVLVIGNSPLPFENTKSRPAAGLRTWQFLKPILDEDYEVTLVTIGMPECYDVPPDKTSEQCDGYIRYSISKHAPDLLSWIQGIHDDTAPDVIISVNTYPSYIASKLKSSAPFWADLNGWIMAEAQAQAHKLEFNDYIPHYLQMEKSILLRADKISTVSEAQKYAALGELATLGRLNGENFGYQMVTAIENATEDFKEGSSANLDYFAGLDNAFVMLWAGGYNTWVDESTLFNGLEMAMRECENLHFVSTGGQIAGLDNKTYSNFQSMIDRSELRDRFKFLGWVKTHEMAGLYARANCGLNVDRDCIETQTGARNRINEMMKFGLPVITTLGSEISYKCAQAGAGIGVRSGDAIELARAIIEIYNEADLQKYSDAGIKYIRQNDYHTTMTHLLQWLKKTEKSPDKNTRISASGRLGILFSALRYLRANGPRAFLRKLRQMLK